MSLGDTQFHSHPELEEFVIPYNLTNSCLAFLFSCRHYYCCNFIFACVLIYCKYSHIFYYFLCLIQSNNNSFYPHFIVQDTKNQIIKSHMMDCYMVPQLGKASSITSDSKLCKFSNTTQHLTISYYAYSKYLLSQTFIFQSHDTIHCHFYYTMPSGDIVLSLIMKYQKCCFLDVWSVVRARQKHFCHIISQGSNLLLYQRIKFLRPEPE